MIDVDMWVKIIQADQEERKQYGYSCFDEPEQEEQEEE